MSSQATAPQQEKPKFSFDAVEKIGKALLLLVALAYTMGLLVSMQHLNSLGISDFNGLRPKYIATGFWTLLLFFIASLPSLMPITMFVTDPRPFKWSKRVVFVAVIGFILFASVAITFEHNILEALGVGLPVYIPSELIKLDATANILVLMSFGLLVGYRRAKTHRLIILVYLIPLGFFLSTRDYIQKVYVQVPEALGGGKPVPAELVLNREGVDFWRQAGMSTKNGQDSTSTGPVVILYQSEHDFVVKAPYKDGQQTKEKLIIFNKSLVNGFLPIEQGH